MQFFFSLCSPHPPLFSFKCVIVADNVTRAKFLQISMGIICTEYSSRYNNYMRPCYIVLRTREKREQTITRCIMFCILSCPMLCVVVEGFCLENNILPFSLDRPFTVMNCIIKARNTRQNKISGRIKQLGKTLVCLQKSLTLQMFSHKLLIQ